MPDLVWIINILYLIPVFVLVYFYCISLPFFVSLCFRYVSFYVPKMLVSTPKTKSNQNQIKSKTNIEIETPKTKSNTVIKQTPKQQSTKGNSWKLCDKFSESFAIVSKLQSSR